ncbi:MAG: hypothetical protein M3454_10890 [Actinomycetota bacterium]|nr:hypothetical protein [Actinomycetota bacterium]
MKAIGYEAAGERVVTTLIWIVLPLLVGLFQVLDREVKEMVAGVLFPKPGADVGSSASERATFRRGGGMPMSSA